ncbi:GNAT family N-acetyltransferase [Flavobacteriaceae bacterium]|nr:GNAT family N-acetyltransferase [Flavobacteriaceae bacterium]MDC1543953.1 GNAT family N-acetyltransferase [Flavobacteriaceae bacterium]
MNLNLRKIELKDNQTLFEWANDNVTRQMSSEEHLISSEEHDVYIKKILRKKTTSQYLFEIDKTPIGTIKEEINTKKNIIQLSYTISPKYRNKGYSKQLLNIYLLNKKGTFQCLIKKINTPSIKLVKSLGFKLFYETNETFVFRLHKQKDTIGNIPKNKNILILAAHPDDETLGCGATIRRLHEEGNYIKLITFTDGESSRDKLNSENRNHKLEKVCKILGIDEFVFGNFPDNSMDTISLLEICKFIENHTKELNPELVFTHFSDDLNIDHQIIAKATQIVFRPQNFQPQKILSYYVPSASDYNFNSHFDGNIFYGISEEQLKAKIDSLRIYEGEMRKFPHSRSYENISNLSKVWGSNVGCELAEKFKLIRESV